jgi:deferrochelatase/peroxidase EfeB
VEILPEWAEGWLKQEPGQAQGLNLALRLKNPGNMVHVLEEIIVRWSRIDQALRVVTSIHYARFVPSYDARALMLIAEYDGPLEQLIKDLAAALGKEVFDWLFPLVETTPQLPVEDHLPWFREFVLFWNRVPFLPPGDITETRLPADFGYPVYCSYRGLTAVAIKQSAVQPNPIWQPSELIEVKQVPDWANSWAPRTGRPAQGLNLALVLEDPLAMPLVLWEIIAAQPKIQHALESLSFLHFARFVPSYDAKALMVITEFDGPLEPYVMDFVIALGDVFDRLLGYVKKERGYRPNLPVRKDPEAFWNFVQYWNRVPFRAPGIANADRLPHGFEYRIYSAYPDKSVIDITGPDRQLPQPAIDKDAAKVDLADVQGNILRGYGARTANHLFFTVTDAPMARAWLSGELTDPAKPWRGITSAERWPSKPNLLVNVAFTFSGMQALLPTKSHELAKFPVEFRAGAQARAIDNGDVDDVNECAKWLFGQDGQAIHVVVSIYTDSFDPEGPAPQVLTPAANPTNWDEFLAATQQLQASAEKSGFKHVYKHQSRALADQREPFGFRDDISQPRISGQCPARDAPDFQPAASAGEFLLGPYYEDIYRGPSIGELPTALALNGTFGAMRLLEQHVDAFDAMVAHYAQQLGADSEQLKSQLMGRWTDGRPVEASTHKELNDFDYAPSWEHPDRVATVPGVPQCPIGAHVRRANPRSARVVGQSHSRRLIRRGMPTTWEEEGLTKKGLLGLFICGSLARQFEFIQRQWLQGDLATTGIRGTSDPIAGLRRQPTSFSLQVPDPKQHSGLRSATITVDPLVTTRGSLYLFFPGIAALRNLDKVNANDRALASTRPLAIRIPEPSLAKQSNKRK